jgi:hypothetical protein
MRQGRKSTLPKILAALELAPAGLTRPELQRITGLSGGTVHKFIHQLHDEGRTHIASWKTDQAGKLGGGVYQARYRLGTGEDKPKPPPLTPTEISRRFRLKAKKTGQLKELRARIAEAKRRRYWRNKPARRDYLVAAFFG